MLEEGVQHTRREEQTVDYVGRVGCKEVRIRLYDSEAGARPGRESGRSEDRLVT